MGRIMLPEYNLTTIASRRAANVIRAGLVSKYGPFSKTICRPLQFFCRPQWVLDQVAKNLGYDELQYVEFAHAAQEGNSDLDESVRALYAGEIDAVATPRFIMTMERMKAGVPYLYPAILTENTMYIRRPDHWELSENSTGLMFDTTLFDPFSPTAWCLLLASLMLLVVAGRVLLHGPRCQLASEQQEPPGGGPSWPKAGRVILRFPPALFCLCMSILYSANLSANIVKPSDPKLPFQDLADLAKLVRRGTYTLVSDTIADSRLELLSKEAKLPGFRELKEALQFNPPHIIYDRTNEMNACKLTALSRSKNYVIIAMEPEARSNCAQQFSKLWQIPFQFQLKMMATYLVAPGRPELSKQLNYAIKSGVYAAEELRYDKFVCATFKSCYAEGQSKHESEDQAFGRRHASPDMINHVHLRVIFVLYGAVLLLAAGVCAIERLISGCRRRNDIIIMRL